MQWAVNPRAVPEDGCFRAAVTVGHHQVFSFGACNDEPREDGPINVHVFNTVSLTWRKLPPAVTPGGGKRRRLEVPSCRLTNHTAVLVGDIVYIWGGHNCFTSESSCNVLYAFDVDAHTWSKPRVSGTVPEGRWGHSACALGTVMFIHGGYNHTGCTNDMYKLDTSSMVWTVITPGRTPPPVSYRHSATIVGTKMFVFGGKGDEEEKEEEDEEESYDTLRVFDTETDLWLDTPSAQQPLPEGRWFHSAFPYNGELYIFNGCNGSEAFNDLWKYSPETSSWKEVELKGKGPLGMTNDCCCIVGDGVSLFGTEDMSNDGLFILDLSPSLKTLCKLAVIQYGLDQAELPHDVRWELEPMMDVE